MIPTITLAEVKAAIVAGVVAFLAVEPASNLLGMITGSQPVDVSTLRAAALAGVTAIVAFVWHAVIGQPATGRAKSS